MKGYRRLGRIMKGLKRPVIWGTFRQTNPFSRVFGYDRGPQSVARYYIDRFMMENAAFICGHVLEIGDDIYTARYGSDIARTDVLHIQEGNPKANIIADLSKVISIPDSTYDCLVMPQTFQFIYDMRSALANCHRIMKPGGTLLATFSGISQVSRYDMDRWGEFWRLTSASARKLFSEFFEEKDIYIGTFGNVLSSVAFLEGLSSNELNQKELDFHDPDYELIITLRAQKQILSGK